jgi:hypothetical protein
MKHNTRFVLAFLVLLLISCDLEVPVPVRNNPLDANNIGTGGDPFNLTAEIANGGVHLMWQAVNINGLTGYNIYRKEDNNAFTQILQVNLTTQTHTDRTIQNGHRYVYYVVTHSNSAEGDASNLARVSIDTDPVIYIEGEDVTHTPTRDVTLTIIAYGADKMLLSNQADFAGATWETFSTVRNWQLSTGEGIKTVYMRVTYSDRDTSGTISDQIEPQSLAPSIIIASDSTYINHLDITISSQTTGALQMKLSNLPDSSGINWQDCITDLSWNLISGDGWKHIYVWLKNDFFVSNMVSDSIGLDTRAAISSFTWSSTGGDTLVPDDQVTFRMIASNDDFGEESGGKARVTVEGWSNINLVLVEYQSGWTREWCLYRQLYDYQ